MTRHVATGEILGVPVDVDVVDRVEGNKLVTTVSCSMPHLEWDAGRGVLNVWAPPRMQKELTKEERLFEWLSR